MREGLRMGGERVLCMRKRHETINKCTRNNKHACIHNKELGASLYTVFSQLDVVAPNMFVKNQLKLTKTSNHPN